MDPIPIPGYVAKNKKSGIPADNCNTTKAESLIGFGF